jgi:KipI family sensor histidine kinase inhibitor
VPLQIDTYGPDALLVRFATRGDAAAFARAQALLRHVARHPPAGLMEATPGFTTLLLEFEPGKRPDPRFLSVLLEGVSRSARSDSSGARTIEVPVVYDGPDLEHVATQARLPVSKVIELHSRGAYKVHLLGFAPGFPYLAGLDPRLKTPRLPTPRPRIPAGSVAIGGEYTGIYPVATAGGWNLIGRTDVRLLDLNAAAAADENAFRLRPGDSVRFVLARPEG